MSRTLLPLSAVVVLASAVAAQDLQRDYRELFKKPETTLEFWKALDFEVEVGRYDLAARHLRGLVDKKPTDKDLVELVERSGLSSILRLRNIRKWSSDPKEQAQALKDVDELIQMVRTAYEKHLADPVRITRFIRNLNATPEERAFAMQELDRSGPVAVPYLIEALQTLPPEGRVPVLDTLVKMRPEATPPIVAALDIPDPALVADLIEVLRQRGDRRAVPFLWYPYAAPQTRPDVRQAATRALSTLLQTEPGSLPSPKVALTTEAERYYQGKVSFPNPAAVVVWRWDGKRVVQGWPDAPTVSKDRAEEYYGLRFAGQALDLDPTYRPAQVVFLSLALMKAMYRTGPEMRLAEKEPRVQELLATTSPDLITAVLERALNDKRDAVILGAVRALGDLADPRAVRPVGRGEPALVRALDYPDRRIQFAAAEAILRLPQKPSSLASSKVVEVLRRAVAGDVAAPQPKVLLGEPNADIARVTIENLGKIGFAAEHVRNGKDLLRRLNQAADIDLVMVNADLQDPCLTYLFPQLRADIHYGHLPVLLLAAEPERRLPPLPLPFASVSARVAVTNPTTLEEAWKALQFELRAGQRERAAVHLRAILARNPRPEELVVLVGPDRLAAFRDIEAVVQWSTTRPINEQAVADVQQLSKLAAAAFANVEVTLRAAVERLDAEIVVASPPRRAILRQDRDRYQAALQRLLVVPDDRLVCIRDYIGKYRNVWAEPAAVVMDDRLLRTALVARLDEASSPMLNPAERKAYAERALVWLARLARGEIAGYDVRPAGDAVLEVVREGAVGKEAMLAAIEVAGYLPGTKPQTVLLDVLLDGNRPPEQRRMAAIQLVRQIQQRGLALNHLQVGTLEALVANPATEPAIKAEAALALGAMRPNARLTGERLRQFAPPTGPVPMPMPPMEPKPPQ